MILRITSAVLILSALVTFAAGPTLTRPEKIVVIPVALEPKDNNTNTTILLQVSTNLVEWTTLTNTPANGSNNVFRIQAFPDYQFYRTGLTNLLSVSEWSEPTQLPGYLTGVRPTIGPIRVEPVP